MGNRYEKHLLYQLSVQDPAGDAMLYRDMAAQLRPGILGRTGEPVVFREDFCGTFALSCAWARLSDRHRALALDLDPVPLEYGIRNNLAKLSADQRARVSVLRRDVASITRPEADLIVAGNFSFFYLKERAQAVGYFRRALRSLKPGGALFLEVIGGKGFTEEKRERRRVDFPGGRPFTYVWEQRGFDPLTSEASYAIHFRLPDGSRLDDAFVYHWRLWGVREIREAMAEAGFSLTRVFWEEERRGKGTGRYVPSERGSDDEVWIAYVAGIRG